MTASIALLSMASGAVVGCLLALFGGGGSVLATPLLLYVVGIDDPHVAIGTSALAVALNAFVGLLGHWRERRVHWACASVFAAAGLFGSIAGSSLAKSVSGQRLLVLFAAAMAAIALSMLRRPRASAVAQVRLTRAVAVRLVPLGLGTGFAAGFFGIGGGFLIVPGLMAGAGMTMANASASSLLSVGVFGAATSMNYALAGLVRWPIALAFVLGGAGGGWCGLRGARHLAQNVLLARRAFAGLVLLVAVYVAWKGAGC